MSDVINKKTLELKDTLLASIRAYGAEEHVLQESMKRINRYTTAGRAVYNLNRWVCVRLDIIAALFAASLAAYLVYFQKHSASNVGFSLNMAGEQKCYLLLDYVAHPIVVGFSSLILHWVRSLNILEVEGTSSRLGWLHHELLTCPGNRYIARLLRLAV